MKPTNFAVTIPLQSCSSTNSAVELKRIPELAAHGLLIGEMP